MLYAKNICTCIFVKGPAKIGAFTESTGQCSGIVLIFSQVEHHFPIDLPIMLPGRGWLFEASSAWELKAGVAMSWSLKQWFASTMFLRGFSNRFTLASLWEIVWSEEVHQSCDVLWYIRCQTLFFNFFCQCQVVHLLSCAFYLNKQVGIFEVFRLADSAEIWNVVHCNDSRPLRGRGNAAV